MEIVALLTDNSFLLNYSYLGDHSLSITVGEQVSTATGMCSSGTGKTKGATQSVPCGKRFSIQSQARYSKAR